MFNENKSLNFDKKEKKKWLIKKYHLSKKKSRIVYKSFNDSFELIYTSIQEELREKLDLYKREKYYYNIKNIFQLLFLFQFERDNDLKKEWKKQLYFHGLKFVRNRFEWKNYQ